MDNDLDKEYLPHDKSYYKEKTSIFFGSLFKYFFLFLLIILIFRFCLNLDTFSTIDIFRFLEGCPDTLGSLANDLKSFFIYEPNPDGFIAMLGFSNFFSFFSKVIGVIAYIFASLIHLINILIYFIGFILG